MNRTDILIDGYSFFTQNALYGVQEIKQEYTSLAHLLAPDLQQAKFSETL